MDKSASFASYLDDLLTGQGYWEGRVVLVPANLCVAVLSLVQHLIEELDPSPVPAVLVGPSIRLNNALGAIVHDELND